MEDISARIQEKFGIEELPHAMFYEFDYALRFELGGPPNRPIRAFVQAYERATAVSQSFFDTSSELFVLLSSYGLEQPHGKRLKPFKLCGLKRSAFCYLGKTAQHDEDHIADFGSDLYRHWDVAQLDDKKTVSEVLWLGIASELLIEPSFRRSTQAYIVDVDNGLALHLYDDRGMDIVSVQKSAAADIYSKFGDWLLDYDLEKMKKTFGKAV